MRAVLALAFSRRPVAWSSHRCFRGFPILVHEVSRRALLQRCKVSWYRTIAAMTSVACRAQRHLRPFAIAGDEPRYDYAAGSAVTVNRVFGQTLTKQKSDFTS